MNNFSIARNAEWYIDPTAFQAIKNNLKESNKMEIYNGDICEVKVGNTERTILVLDVHGKYVSGISLCEDDRLPLSIVAQGMRYGDPAFISYYYKDNVVNYIRSLSSDELDEILLQVIAVFEKNLADKPSKTVTTTPVKLPAATPDTKEHVLETNLELAKVIAERDVFKSLYEQLLASVIK